MDLEHGVQPGGRGSIKLSPIKAHGRQGGGGGGRWRGRGAADGPSGIGRTVHPYECRRKVAGVGSRISRHLASVGWVKRDQGSRERRGRPHLPLVEVDPSASPTGHSASCRRRLSSPPRQGTRPRWFRTTAATVATPRRMRACWRLLRNCSPTGGRAPPQRSQFSRPTADEARVAAAAEGLALVPSSSNEFGFRGVVRKQSGKYQALFKGNDLRLRHLGTFTTSQRRHPCALREAPRA